MSISDWEITAQLLEPAGNNRMDSPFVGLNVVNVALPNGEHGRYVGLDVQPCVTTVPVTNDERLVFVRQTRPLAARYCAVVLHQFLEFPSGFSDCQPQPNGAYDPDDLLAAAVKEMREEAGVTSHRKIYPISPSRYQPYPQLSNEINHVFLAEGVELGGKPHSDEPTEGDIEVFTMTPDKILAAARGEAQPAAPLSGSTMAALFMALPRLS